MHKPQLKHEWYLKTDFRVPDKELIMIKPALRSKSLYKRKAGAIQIVTIGDSFTEGYPVTKAQSYQNVLTGIFEKRIFMSRRSMQVSAIRPDQQLKLLQNAS